ncbi:DASH complex subunit Ask1-domain-containing protein [Lineolata rhizophorae]|uniref:DASH complex subunit ASK1 n=1 Tax=Lineolata rhizophorae TaxID=578093 RepID=A0A6A6NX40_9PEZI|nr:DASH complex subunit Ask1-domain-containing protein [Lineolata rhizophorae]
MARPSTMTMRNLTLTEELEKLEQSITLTLQEIDHNFSRAHRIVTTSILPVVEQYAKHSEAVWEGSKFWKQFFEASANVSLSGYEDVANQSEGGDVDSRTYDDHTTTQEGYTETTADQTISSDAGEKPAKPTGVDYDDVDSTPLMSSPSVAHAHSTPRAPTQSRVQTEPSADEEPSFAEYPSPYETLKREIHGETSPPGTSAAAKDARAPPKTPGKQTLPDMSMSPSSSPFAPAPPSVSSAATGRRANPNTDPLLHHVLNKTYRIAATPHTARKTTTTGTTPGRGAGAGAEAGASTARQLTFDDSSPLSSPAAPPPQLRADIFSSPLKSPVRTPGVSVQTPGRKQRAGGGRDRDEEGTPPGTRTYGGGGGGGGGLWDSDSDEEEFSPPKTMMFHVPQGRVLQTPAREASKRIVDDLLLTAGGDFSDDGQENSPSVVRPDRELDDSF